MPCIIKKELLDKDPKELPTNGNAHGNTLEISNNYRDADQNQKFKENEKNLEFSQMPICITSPTNQIIIKNKEDENKSLDFSEENNFSIRLDFESIGSFGASPIQQCGEDDSFISEFHFSSKANSPIKEQIKAENSPGLKKSESSCQTPEPIVQNFVRSDTPHTERAIRKMPKLPPLTPDLFQLKARQFRKGFRYVLRERKNKSETNAVTTELETDVVAA
mmetsp:Transcript_22969/g.22700  ORF Transcript_22969/g.22700 Transcript_22969/m.22700 type:complete len:220 (-) Transcript_22969:13-672(-)